MARPKAETPSVRYGFTLRLSPVLHADLIQLIEAAPNKAQLIAQGLYALKYGAAGQNPDQSQHDETHADVEALLSNWDY